MKIKLNLLPAAFVIFAINIANTQPATVMQLFSARWYNNLEGEARKQALIKLQQDHWYTLGTLYGMDHSPEKPSFQVSKTYLAPYQDDHGNAAHLVPEVAPQFPGGNKALEQFKSDVLGTLYAGPNDEVQKSFYIRCTVGKDGVVSDIMEAQEHDVAVIPRELLLKCMDAVRYMPEWKPGYDRGKPVNVCVLIDFSLKE